ncbi:flippase-like domain-containing protein, partial [candidate division KSB1 bacterium]|nr:flippase-like domain-containing protein [candidate division KSB1 bacterium]
AAKIPAGSSSGFTEIGANPCSGVGVGATVGTVIGSAAGSSLPHATAMVAIATTLRIANMRSMLLLIVETGVITFCILLVTKKDFTLRLTDKILNLMPQSIQQTGKNIITSFLEGLEIIKAMQHFFILISTSFAVWIAACAQIFLMILAFDANLTLGTTAVASVVVMVLISFALTLPAAPGFVGTFHFAAISGLIIFSVNPGIASAFAVSLHLVSYIPITLTGFYYFMQENIKFSSARSELSEATEKT